MTTFDSVPPGTRFRFPSRYRLRPGIAQKTSDTSAGFEPYTGEEFVVDPTWEILPVVTRGHFADTADAWRFINYHAWKVEQAAKNVAYGGSHPFDVEGQILAIQDRLPAMLAALEFVRESYPDINEVKRANAVAFWRPRPEELVPGGNE